MHGYRADAEWPERPADRPSRMSAGGHDVHRRHDTTEFIFAFDDTPVCSPKGENPHGYAVN